MIHVCFGIHDKTGHYSKFAGTSMLSIFENTTSKVTVHILHDNTLTQENRDKFSYLAGKYNQLVNFYNVEKICAEKINEMIKLLPSIETSRVSIGAFYRFLIPQILSNDIYKCIYLDSDMIVNLNIAELWAFEPDENYPLAAVPENIASSVHFKNSCPERYLITESLVKMEDYFNSALIMMNLDYLRKVEKYIMDGIKWRGEHLQCSCFDQDIWNYLFAKNYLKLPGKFDQFAGDERTTERNLSLRKVIYHFSGTDKGYGVKLHLSDPLNRLWMNYFIKTPWFDVDTIAGLTNGMVNQIFNKALGKWTARTKKYSATLAGKTRAFVISDDKSVKWIKENYGKLNEDEFIVYDGDPQKLVKNILARRNDKAFFIRVGSLSGVLMELGLVEGEDFINSMSFLKMEKPKSINTHSIVLTM